MWRERTSCCCDIKRPRVSSSQKRNTAFENMNKTIIPSHWKSIKATGHFEKHLFLKNSWRFWYKQQEPGPSCLELLSTSPANSSLRMETSFATTVDAICVGIIQEKKKNSFANIKWWILFRINVETPQLCKLEIVVQVWSNC